MPPALKMPPEYGLKSYAASWSSTIGSTIFLTRLKISDAEYDALFRELQRLEEQYPALVSPESPTRRVGGAALDKFSSVTHRLPMLSLENAANAGEIRDFDLRVKKIPRIAARSA